IFRQTPPTSNRQLPPTQEPPRATPPTPPPSVKLDRIVLGPPPTVEGQVVRSDRAPHAGAKVLFVSADRQGAQQTVTADSQGQFHADLEAGAWLAYVHGYDGKPIFQSKIDVQPTQTPRVTLASR